MAAYQKPDIMATYGTTVQGAFLEGTAFYRKVHSETNFAYCIFASEAIINRISELPEDRRHFFMDAMYVSRGAIWRFQSTSGDPCIIF